MNKEFKVVIELYYENGEDMSSFSGEYRHAIVDTATKAIDTARDEIEQHGIYNFDMKVYNENGELLLSD